MADGLSIATSALALLTIVAKTTVGIARFSRQCRDARSDLSAVTGELSQLQLVLEILKDDPAVLQNRHIPDDVQTRTLSTIQSCCDVINKINVTLQKCEGRAGTVKWVAFTKAEVGGLRESLKAHRDTLSMALEVVSLLYGKSIKEDTTAIRGDVDGIAQNTIKIPEILEELQQLRAIVAAMPSVTTNQRTVIQQYLDSLTSCAETVCDEPVVWDASPHNSTHSLSRPPSRGQETLTRASTAPSLLRGISFGSLIPASVGLLVSSARSSSAQLSHHHRHSSGIIVSPSPPGQEIPTETMDELPSGLLNAAQLYREYAPAADGPYLERLKIHIPLNPDWDAQDTENWHPLRRSTVTGIPFTSGETLFTLSTSPGQAMPILVDRVHQKSMLIVGHNCVEHVARFCRIVSDIFTVAPPMYKAQNQSNPNCIYISPRRSGWLQYNLETIVPTSSFNKPATIVKRMAVQGTKPDIILACFSCENSATLQLMKELMNSGDRLREYCGDCPIVLVGLDLQPDVYNPDKIVTTREAIEAAEEINAVTYLECKLKGNGEDVVKVLGLASHCLMERPPPAEKRDPAKGLFERLKLRNLYRRSTK